MNPAQLLLNQMMNSPQVQNNPMAKNAMQMYQRPESLRRPVHLSKRRGVAKWRFPRCAWFDILVYKKKKITIYV